jgi:hypothetical protein
LYFINAQHFSSRLPFPENALPPLPLPAGRFLANTLFAKQNKTVHLSQFFLRSKTKPRLAFKKNAFPPSRQKPFLRSKIKLCICGYFFCEAKTKPRLSFSKKRLSDFSAKKPKQN